MYYLNNADRVRYIHSRGSRQVEPKHVPALDGLRGIAILLVLFRHYAYVGIEGRGWVGQTISNAALHGILGVDLFFVLSGFLISGILFDAIGSQNYFKNFYMRRFLRIFPLYYGFLLFLVIFTHRLGIVWEGMLPVYLTYTQNIFVGALVTTLWKYTGQFWSLAVEEQFYIVWPLLIFFIKDRKMLMWIAGLLSVSALLVRIFSLHSGISPVLIYRLPLCRMDELLAGAWVAFALRGGTRQWLHARWIFVLCCLGYAFLESISARPSLQKFDLMDVVGFSIIAIGFAALLGLTLDQKSTVSKACKNLPLRWLGKYSYGIYVLHLAVLQICWKAMNKFTGLERYLFHLHATSIAVAISSLIITLALAWLSYNFYEIYFLNLKKHFSYGRPARQPAISF